MSLASKPIYAIKDPDVPLHGGRGEGAERRYLTEMLADCLLRAEKRT